MGEGLSFGISLNIATTFSSVIVTVLLLVANIITFFALDAGASAYFGAQLAKKDGYSLAIAGFLQREALTKIGFCNELSLNSSCRKLLTRIAAIWMILECIKILTPLSATSMTKKSKRMDNGFVNCIEFGQRNQPVDRMVLNFIIFM
jgi:hypothetical protein